LSNRQNPIVSNQPDNRNNEPIPEILKGDGSNNTNKGDKNKQRVPVAVSQIDLSSPPQNNMPMNMMQPIFIAGMPPQGWYNMPMGAQPMGAHPMGAQPPHNNPDMQSINQNMFMAQMQQQKPGNNGGKVNPNDPAMTMIPRQHPQMMPGMMHGMMPGMMPQMMPQDPALRVVNAPGQSMPQPTSQSVPPKAGGAPQQVLIDPALKVVQNTPPVSTQMAPKQSAPMKVGRQHAVSYILTNNHRIHPIVPNQPGNNKQGDSKNDQDLGDKSNSEPSKNDNEDDKQNDDQEKPKTHNMPNRLITEDELPAEIIIETDLALRRKLKELEQREDHLLNVGALAIENYDEIFDELDEELANAEQQILDMHHNKPEMTENGLSILKEKNFDILTGEFEDCITSMLRTDTIVRSNYRKDAYFKIHRFQWKSRQIHTYNLVNGEVETVLINAGFNIPLFSRSIAIENGDIYLTGGQYKPYYLRTTFFFDEGSNTLEKKADMTLARGDHSLIYLAGYIYAIGSYMNNKTCERYNVLKNKWAPISSMNIGRAGSGLCTFDNAYIYAFGGRNGKRTILNAIECYSIENDIWRKIEYATKDNWIPCYMGLAHQVTENEIMIFGGKSAKTQLVSRESYIYDIETGEFKDGPPLRNPSSFMNSVICHDNHLYVFGNDVYIHRFSLIDQLWSINDKHNYDNDVQQWL
jgi:hypothetical protein